MAPESISCRSGVPSTASPEKRITARPPCLAVTLRVIGASEGLADRCCLLNRAISNYGNPGERRISLSGRTIAGIALSASSRSRAWTRPLKRATSTATTKALSLVPGRVPLVLTKHNHDPFRTRRSFRTAERLWLKRCTASIAIPVARRLRRTLER